MTSKPEQVEPSQVADERLTGAHDLALTALREITAADTVGPAAGYTLEEDGVVSLRFHTRLSAAAVLSTRKIVRRQGLFRTAWLKRSRGMD